MSLGISESGSLTRHLEGGMKQSCEDAKGDTSDLGEEKNESIQETRGTVEKVLQSLSGPLALSALCF